MSLNKKTGKLVSSLLTVAVIGLVLVLVVKIGLLLRSNEEPSDQLVSITAPVLKAALDQHQRVVVLDVRSREQYASGHIPVAKNIPYDELEVRAPNELSQEDRIITYCRCLNDIKSDLARQTLLSLGFRNVVFLKGGIRDWEEQQYGTAKSEQHVFHTTEQEE